MNEFRAFLFLPPPACSPNSTANWVTKYKAKKGYRESSMLIAMSALDGRAPPRWEKAEARVTARFRKHRKRDRDNFAASLKAAWDGVADAGILLNDVGLVPHPPEFIIDPTRTEGVEVVITPIPSAKERA